MRSRQLITILVVGFVWSGSLVLGTVQAEEKKSQPEAWRLIWNEDPAHQATVSWNTKVAGEKHVVHIRKSDSGETRIVGCDRNGKFSGGDGLYYHHAQVGGLQPDTKYEVVMESDDRRSPTFYFRTAPETDKPVKILFGGDSRSGLEDRKRVNKMLAKLVEQQPEIIAFAHGGDFVNHGTSHAQWRLWMKDHELTVTKDNRLLPIIPARGNHDRGELINEIFAFPKGDLNYYVSQLTPQICLITLNTSAPTSGDQARWLEKMLQKHRPQVRWLVAQYHKPAYPAVKVPSGAFTSWVPLFEKYDLDLACEADGHTIKRTMPIRNGKPDPTGVVYVGEGGLGVSQRTPKSDRWFLQSPGITGSGHHVQLLSFAKDGLKCESILLEGKIFDSVTLKPRNLKSKPSASE